MDKNLVHLHILNGSREIPIKGTPKKYYNLYSECWQDDGIKRPNIAEVGERLSALEYLNDDVIKKDNTVPTLCILAREIKINIFRFILHPKNLSLTCRCWNDIINCPQARAEWILYHYGNAHSLFHAVRLGPCFINNSVAESILAKGGLFSHYFAQRLLMDFGCIDNFNELVEHKIRHIKQADAEKIQHLQKKNSVHWACDLPIQVFIYLVLETPKRFNELEIALKGNDMKLFHLYTGDVNKINERLSELIELGFKLTYSVICDILEHRFYDIGEILLESFLSLKKDNHFFENCVIEVIKPERNLKKMDLLDFLYNNMKQNQEEIFLNAMRFYHFNGNDCEKLKTYTTSIRPLSLSKIYYDWALSKFKANSIIASLCFEDILQTRISIISNLSDKKPLSAWNDYRQIDTKLLGVWIDGIRLISGNPGEYVKSRRPSSTVMLMTFSHSQTSSKYFLYQ
ncbi:5187_t:CDS:2, partial [Cetraspora pellucida]